MNTQRFKQLVEGETLLAAESLQQAKSLLLAGMFKDALVEAEMAKRRVASIVWLYGKHDEDMLVKLIEESRP